VGQRARLSAAEFAQALRDAVRHVYDALERPVEGTIITVMREVADEASTQATGDFGDLVELMLTRAQHALARTPELLPALRAAGVVDAGAKGFVAMMEGVAAFAKGDPFVALAAPLQPDNAPIAAASAAYPADSERFRFCTEALMRGAALPDAASVRAALREHGDSLIVLRTGDVLKVHIHTDDPERVFGYLRGQGELVTHKAEDMQAQHEAVERAAAAHVSLARRAISIVTDSAADLPREVVQAHGIHVVPLSLVYPEQVLRDGIDIHSAEFIERMKRGEHPTTSQPPPAAFMEAYRRAAVDGETVVGVILGSGLSGTFASAEAAARQMPDLPIRLVDSQAATVTQGMLVLLAAELAERGRDAATIVAELQRVRAQSSIMFTVDTFERLLASGRVGRGQVMIAGLLDIRPVLEIGLDGKVKPVARVRGRANVPARMLALLEQRVPRAVKKVRFGVIHVDFPEIAERMKQELRARYGERDVLVVPATPVIATHTGPRAWGLGWQVED
ncbi:MAG: DegV family protein, partial [Longimicrobiales bacterium]